MARQKGALEGKVEKVTLKGLIIDHTYQRGLRPHWRKIRDQWNPQAAMILTVGWRGWQDGALALVDGQVRQAAMMALGIERWQALVFHSTSVEHESHVYQMLNDPKYRKGLSVKELYKSLLVAQDPVAVATKAAVEDAGLELVLTGQRVWPRITAIRACLSAVESHGITNFARAMKVVAAGWDGQDWALVDFIPTAMSALIEYNPNFDDARMVKVLQGRPAARVAAEVSAAAGNRKTKARQILCDLYNTRMGRANKITPVKPKKEDPDDEGEHALNGAARGRRKNAEVEAGGGAAAAAE